jgi:hypothetical protein
MLTASSASIAQNLPLSGICYRTDGVTPNGGAGAIIRLGDAATIWHSLLESVFNPYRPALHCIRGPGPKWRAKHGGL